MNTEFELVLTAAGEVALEAGFGPKTEVDTDELVVLTPVRSTARAVTPAVRCTTPAVSANRCACGRAKGSAKLCDACFRRAPDYIIDQYLNGTSQQRAAAERWLATLAQPVA